jgi:hypothetical protein
LGDYTGIHCGQEHFITYYRFLAVHVITVFKLRVIRQTANAKQRKILRYQAIKSKINELAVLKP